MFAPRFCNLIHVVLYSVQIKKLLRLGADGLCFLSFMRYVRWSIGV